MRATERSRDVRIPSPSLSGRFPSREQTLASTDINTRLWRFFLVPIEEATKEKHLSRPSLVAKTPDQSDGFATDFCAVAELNFCDKISCFPLPF